MPTPALDDIPESNPWLDYMLDAHNILLCSSTDEFGRITLTEIKSFIELFEVEVEVETFVPFLQELNSKYVELVSAERERKMKSQPKGLK